MTSHPFDSLRRAFRFERTPSGPGGRADMTVYPSHPFRERLEGNDAQTWVQPTSPLNDYQSFWVGDQLPGVHIQVLPDVRAPFIEPVFTAPQRSGGSFGKQLGQLGTQRLIARWQTLWNSRGG